MEWSEQSKIDAEFSYETSIWKFDL